MQSMGAGAVSILTCVMWEATECFTVTFASGLPGPARFFATPIVLEGMANIPGVLAMWSPCTTLVQFLVDKDSHSRRTKWCAVVIVGNAADLIPARGQLGVHQQIVYHVEGELRIYPKAGRVGMLGGPCIIRR